MIEAQRQAIIQAHDKLVMRYSECIVEIAKDGYNALLVSEMVGIFETATVLKRMLADYA